MARIDAGGEVVAAADEVERGGGEVAGRLEGEGVEQHAVDGEVAAEDVLAGAGGEADGVGAAAVGVGAVGAEGGDLGGDVRSAGLRRADEDDAEVGSDREGAGKRASDLVGRGGGGDVVVLWGEAEEEVADAAAGEEGLMAGGAERARDAERGGVLRCRICHTPLPLTDLRH